jgi:hypothetical protein
MIGSSSKRQSRAILPERVDIMILFAVAALIAVYALLRYSGHWGEGDTSTFSRAIRSVADSGRIAPPGKFVYGNGYSYSSLVVFLMNLCGLSLAEVQIYGASLMMVWLVLPAWLAYRELTESRRGATLATVILLIQPELLFAVLRGTHEKFTRGLMLLCIYLLLQSLRSRHNLARFIGLVLAFYIVGYAIITFNNLMATSFTVAVGLALGLSWAITRRELLAAHFASAMIRRLAYVVAVLGVLAVLFSFYAYLPSRQGLLLIESMWERTSALLLNVEQQSSNPYAVINSIWINSTVYFLVSLANWLLLLSSAIIWMWQSVRWLRRRSGPQGERELLLWAFYGAFAFQGGLSIIVDTSGALASNLQHRIFPSFAMLAAPLVARQLAGWQPRRPLVARLGDTALGLGIGALAVLSALKATNEPLLSNKWLFYEPGELQAVAWSNEKLAYRFLWSEYDERLFAAMRIANSATNLDVNIIPDVSDQGVRDALISDVTRSHSERLSQPLPIEADSFITYDNGQAQIYHQRPRTPYQP